MDEDNAEVCADLTGAGEEAEELFGAGGGGDVEVFGGAVEEEVADAAADEEGGMAGFAEDGDDPAGQ